MLQIELSSMSEPYGLVTLLIRRNQLGGNSQGNAPSTRPTPEIRAGVYHTADSSFSVPVRFDSAGIVRLRCMTRHSVKHVQIHHAASDPDLEWRRRLASCHCQPMGSHMRDHRGVVNAAELRHSYIARRLSKIARDAATGVCSRLAT